MTEIVLHSAGEVDGPATRRQLADSRDRLAELGIGLPDSDDPAEWSSLARQLLRGVGGDQAAGLLTVARERGLSAVVLSADDLLDRAPDRDALRQLRRWARRHDTTVRFVVTVEDQVAALNSRFCRAVHRLDWSGSFSEYVDDAEHLACFDYPSRLGALLDGPLDTVVLSRQASGDQPVVALLSALGISEDRLGALRAAPTTEPRLGGGPLELAAVRLLNKRMRRLSVFNRHPRRELLQPVEALSAQAAAHHWDSMPFWGWTDDAADAAAARFAAGNAEVAARAWGSPWQEPTATGASNEVDLAAADPALVVELLDTVDSLVHDLRRRSRTHEPTASAS